MEQRDAGRSLRGQRDGPVDRVEVDVTEGSLRHVGVRHGRLGHPHRDGNRPAALARAPDFARDHLKLDVGELETGAVVDGEESVEGHRVLPEHRGVIGRPRKAVGDVCRGQRGRRLRGALRWELAAGGCVGWGGELDRSGPSDE
jgi:hypothetical protein